MGSTNMRVGAVAILDALGFKGIWREYDAGTIAAALRVSKSPAPQVQQLFAHMAPVLGVPLPETRCLAISDTLVIAALSAVEPGDPKEHESFSMAVDIACFVVNLTISRALDHEPALLFRGCVAAGPVYNDPDYLIGRAVDEAAEYMEVADGPFVWLLPSASTVLSRKNPVRALTVDFPVPLKDGRHVHAPVVSPLALAGAKEREQRRAKILATFTDPKRLGHRPPGIDVLIKMQHTERFLQEAERSAGVTSAKGNQQKKK